MTGHLESPASSSSSPSSKRPRKSLILCQLVLADSVVPLGSRQGLTRPDATFVALSTVTALTAETKFAPHTLGVSRDAFPNPHPHSVHADGFDREPTAHGSSITPTSWPLYSYPIVRPPDVFLWSWTSSMRNCTRRPVARRLTLHTFLTFKVVCLVGSDRSNRRTFGTNY